jgi:hypothetical protein
MTINIETGEGTRDADSYASVESADARCVALGVTDWAPRTDAEKEVALRRSTQFMLANYRKRWAGRRVYQAQALDWPRWNVVVDDFPVLSTVVPAEVVNACIDLAVRAARGEELLPDLETGNNQVKRDKTGPLETEYFEHNTDAAARFVAIDAMLEPFFGAAGGAGMIKVVRG